MRKGDTIRFLDDVGGGKVVQYDANQQLVWVETDDGFLVGPIPASKCVLASPMVSYQRMGHAPKAKTTETTTTTSAAPKAAPGKKPKRQRDEHLIDLHLEALPTNGNGMNDVRNINTSCASFACRCSNICAIEDAASWLSMAKAMAYCATRSGRYSVVILAQP